ncbi:G-type lectin S-receptor-like serine/threonine-protein kinase At4g27290 [Rutidosis leptorrhynchoides]|uniref:G-type lectin S-receptor-like serine/threonine-protein kinase At4g27290 n=1 Tax=Rutidosis leptorrhynchoides TaxID=125765 RepID=UPI003A99B727
MISPLFFILFASYHVQNICAAEIDIISDSQFLTENDTLVSPGGIFELGFFTPGSSDNRYIGIWYKKISVKTVVWVANRNDPITGASSSSSSSVLKIIQTGDLVLMNNTSTNNNHVIWSSNTSSSSNAIAKLDDIGNLVITDGEQNKIIWQSFDYPTDTLLSGMKFGRNFLTGKEWSLSAWKSDQDPGVGNLTYSVDTQSYPQDYLKEGDVIKFRAGPWNGLRFSGASDFSKNPIFTYNMVIDEKEVAFVYTLVNSSVVSKFTVSSSSGKVERSVWVEEGQKWQLMVALPREICDDYNICGAYGTCSLNAQVCSCLDEVKFVPRNEKGWEAADWSGGCMRRKEMDCENGSDGFIKYSNVKLPDTHNSWFDQRLTLKECEELCHKNCSCTAYVNTNISGRGSGCLLWFDDLMDLRVYSEGKGGQDLYIRMAASELVGQSASKNRGRNIKFIILIAFISILVIGLSITLFCYAWRKRRYRYAQEMEKFESMQACESQKEGMELPLFNFSTIAKVTGNFSLQNKLGEGGFGPVYKGMLEDGQEIAVKRLSKTSSQGINEFKNEVICISKLQHRNLVRLLGCSIDGDEKLLIYEYMPNKSLDFFIFDKTRSTLLDWEKRFNIIKGIARGLLYLHQDSRLRIIHRDLKASNILLDHDLNPKISDFGIARSFGTGNETEASTERVVGTYGYMSPEYALDGVFSTKSDVFSFGVLVLEIVSGKRNRGFFHPEHSNNLIGHAWRVHDEGRSMELIDTALGETSNQSEVIRSIEVGLLCAQQNPEDRPNMSDVVQMLGNEIALQKPKQPAFFLENKLFVGDFSSSSYPTSTTNDQTVTEVVAR